MAHRNEILDDHMNHSNWKELISMSKYLIILPLHCILTTLFNVDILTTLFNVESLLVWKMKWAINLLKGSEESYKKLTESVAPADLEGWREGEMTAQQNRD
jgi:hypothetical protein